jgi:GH3 auxin-responsive promoter
MSSHPFIRKLVNRAWIASCSREHARFSGALGRVAETQSRYLFDLLGRNAGTQFGRKHGFATIRSVAEFQAQVTVTHYEALTESIEAIARGEQRVLTEDRVRLFQPTSGSSSATKLIPWTATLGREFRRGVAPWMVALYRRKPALLGGTAYWSISPPGATPRRHGCLPVGFDHDAAYLGYFGRKLFSFVSATPPDLARCRDMNEFTTRTLVWLLADENLGLISIWSPTFLTTLLGDFLGRRDEILNALGQSGLANARGRAGFLRSITMENCGTTFFERAWPHLQVISCWTHGSSELYAENLHQYFPRVEIQGKGLIATEALFSFPFCEGKDPVLAVTSHFFEFQDQATNNIFLAHELVVGNTYRVIVTTGGGFYRYAIGDLIRVTGFIGDAPCLRFIGREGDVSDLFGEKLHGNFVEETIRRVFVQQGVTLRFFMLAPVVDPVAKTSYTLFFEADKVPNPAVLRDAVEAGLAQCFNYVHCRRLEQLQAVRLFQVNQNGSSAVTCVQKAMLQRGLKLGDIKIPVLDRQFGWEQRLPGKFIV